MSPIDRNEKMARFVFSGGCNSKRVLPGAFTPRENDLNPAQSVLRKLTMTELEIWKYGETEVRGTRRESLKGRADFVALDAQDIGLTINPSEPPPGHANIENWPPDLESRQQKATELANKSDLVKKP